MECLKCGLVSPVGAQFCNACGSPISQSVNRETLGLRLLTHFRANWWGYAILLSFLWFCVWSYQNDFAGMRKTVDSFFKDYSKPDEKPAPVRSTPAPEREPVPASRVTKANFEKLQEGMTLEQVVTLLGPIAETKYETKEGKTSVGIYNWGSASNGFIMGEFRNEKLTSKTQISLKY